MPNIETDFLIVGQGLAGSILALQLLSRGYSVQVIDNNHHASSSAVAAGIINPITGHRLNISERFFEYYPVAEEFYRDFEHKHNCSVFTPLQQTRLIKNPGQAEYLEQRLTSPEYLGLIEKCDSAPMHDQGFAAVQVNSTAIVEVPMLLENCRDFLMQQHKYRSMKLNYDEIRITSHGIEIADIIASRLVFCEGYQAIHNPWLSSLPFKLSKGEVLQLKLDTSLKQQLLNWGHWLVCQDNQAKLGSTYHWDDLSLGTTQAVEDKLLCSFESATGLTGVVVDRQAGIRPTTLHRNPFIGPLSGVDNVYCFNGFGSKGCLTVPYYADLFVDCLDNNISFPHEISKWL